MQSLLDGSCWPSISPRIWPCPGGPCTSRTHPSVQGYHRPPLLFRIAVVCRSALGSLEQDVPLIREPASLVEQRVHRYTPVIAVSMGSPNVSLNTISAINTPR